jgi:hypothetical protein
MLRISPKRQSASTCHMFRFNSSRRTSREFSFIQCNSKTPYHIRNSLLLVLIPSHMNSTYILKTLFLNMQFNITLQSTRTSSKWLISLSASGKFHVHYNPLCGHRRISIIHWLSVTLIMSDLPYSDIRKIAQYKLWKESLSTKVYQIRHHSAFLTISAIRFAVGITPYILPWTQNASNRQWIEVCQIWHISNTTFFNINLRLEYLTSGF